MFCLAPGKQSESVKWQVKGNKLLETAARCTAPGIKQFMLGEAKKDHCLAFNTAENDVELSSAARSYAETTWKLAISSVESRKPDEAIRYFKESVRYFLGARNSGRNSQSWSWQTSLEDRMGMCVKRFLVAAKQNFHGAARIDMMVKVLPCLAVETVDGAWVRWDLARTYFGESVTQTQQGEYGRALDSLGKARELVEILGRQWNAELSSVCKKAEELSTDIALQTCIVQSMRLRAEGEE